jgi:polysaccharide pyruvyl transferase WcaK-like protein
MSDALPPTQDGGNSGKLRVDSLSMRKERYLKFKTKTLTLMLRIEISKLATKEMISDNNGRSSMLMNTLSQRKESLTRTSDSTSKEISTLFQHYQVVDTSI